MKKVLIGVVIGLALCALGFGLWKVYDKKDTNEKGNDDYEKITIEKINELYSMVTEGEFYYKEKVTPSSNQLPLLKYALNNYIKEKNINTDKIQVNLDEFYVIGDGDTPIKVNPKNLSEKDGVINKTNFNNYVKEKYNIEISDVKDEKFSLVSGRTYAANTSDSYIVYTRGTSGLDIKLHSKMTDYKEDKDYLYIYDKVVIEVFDVGSLYLEKYMDASNNEFTFYCSSLDCNGLKKLTDDEIDNQMVNKYKHTFKKNSDKTYSFVSSEYLGN